jgi:hypothetical protein
MTAALSTMEYSHWLINAGAVLWQWAPLTNSASCGEHVDLVFLRWHRRDLYDWRFERIVR